MTPLISGRLAVATSRAEFKAPNTSGATSSPGVTAAFHRALAAAAFAVSGATATLLLAGKALRSRWVAIPVAVRGVIVARSARLRLLAPALRGQGTAQAEGQRGRRSSLALAVAGLFVGRLGYRLRASWAHLGTQAALALAQGSRARFAQASGGSFSSLTAGPMLRLREAEVPGVAAGAATIVAATRSSGPLLRATTSTFLRVDGSARRLRTHYAL